MTEESGTKKNGNGLKINETLAFEKLERNAIRKQLKKEMQRR